MVGDDMSSFEHLDDPQPPSLDDSRWQRIQNRSRELARRRRVARTTVSAAAVIAVVLGAAGLALVAHSQPGERVVTFGAPSTTDSSTPGSTASTLDPSVWVTVKVEVDETVVEQGHNVTGTVVFDNHRPVRLALPDAADAAAWQVAIGSGAVEPVVGWLDSAPAANRLDLPPGITRVPFVAITRQQVGTCPNTALDCPALLPAGAARAWFVVDGPVPEHIVIPAPVAITITGRGGPAPRPQPCPVPSREPSMATGQYCGPVPPPGNGLGPNGECTGRETTVPCGAGVVPGKYYAFTFPGRCDGVIIFDGRRWISELPPPTSVPDIDVWIRLDANGGLGFISPNGAVAFTPDHHGQPTGACTR
jgi:hypothetical protein